MPSWNSRGLRGQGLEELVNLTNEKYRDRKLAVVQKVPTPITPIKIDSETKQITLAYFEQKSTVDYIGVVQGIPVCFDAKDCMGTTFPLQNVHEHQIKFMKEFEEQSGIAFLLIHFAEIDTYYYLRFAKLYEFWQRAENGGRKSFRYEELDERYQISTHEGVFVHYLEALQLDLDEREE